MAGTLLVIFQTRLELFSSEVEEERLNIEQMLFYGSIALFFFGLAILLLTIFIVVVFWDSYRLRCWPALSGCTLSPDSWHGTHCTAWPGKNHNCFPPVWPHWPMIATSLLHGHETTTCRTG